MTMRGQEMVDDFAEKAPGMDNPIASWLADVLKESRDELPDSDQALTRWVQETIARWPK